MRVDQDSVVSGDAPPALGVGAIANRCDVVPRLLVQKVRTLLGGVALKKIIESRLVTWVWILVFGYSMWRMWWPLTLLYAAWLWYVAHSHRYECACIFCGHIVRARSPLERKAIAMEHMLQCEDHPLSKAMRELEAIDSLLARRDAIDHLSSRHEKIMWTLIENTRMHALIEAAKSAQNAKAEQTPGETAKS